MAALAQTNRIPLPGDAGHAPAWTLGAMRMRRVDGGEWDRVVSGFDGVCQEQLHAFAAIRWPGLALEANLFEIDDRVVGGALMMIQKLAPGLPRIAISKWAPMLAESRDPDAVGLYENMIEALVDDYARNRGMLVSILPAAAVEAVNTDYLTLRHRGFRPGPRLPYPDRYLVRLGIGQAEQRKSLGQTWRRQLAKAEKCGLTFEEVSGGLDQFKALYAAMSERKQFPDHSAFATIEQLMALDEPARPALFFVRHEGETVAGAIVFKAGDRASYLYGATNDKALPLRAGYFMQWHIVGWLGEHSKASWYDLGGTDGFSGLHQFKKGLVGDAGVIRPMPPMANYGAGWWSYGVGAGALQARELVNQLRRRLGALRPGARPDLLPNRGEDEFR
jgi:hypothetical protein